MPLNALIVDDEEYSRKSLYFLLQENCPEINVGGIVGSVAEARKIIEENSFDLVFLDIAMPKENGFELLPTLQKNKILVVFITAFDQYALKALKASAVDYLLKPIDINELKIAVKKAAERIEILKSSNLPGTIPPLNALSENLHTKNKIEKITLPHTNGFHIIDTSNIIYIEADSNYSVFHLKNAGNLIISKPLKEFEDMLDDDFARIHKSAIINLKYVNSYSNKHGFEVILEKDTVLPVSRRRSAEFQEKLREFIQTGKANI
ncbi:LytTR family DNA-binding domain-containing protein [Pedobacter sp. P351]|uniref:LytR/AlgR family response regulator transcription factor n=1 Tax=Pedobacter superstes TaxID=3133441 RepID=UPI0030B61C59